MSILRDFVGHLLGQQSHLWPNISINAQVNTKALIELEGH